MRSKRAVIAVLVILAAALICAAVLYNHLSRKPQKEETAVAEETSGADKTAEENADGETVPFDLPAEQEESEPAGITDGEKSETAEPASDSGTTSAVETSSDAEPASELPDAVDFLVETMDGEEVRLSDMQGKPVIVNFWATWCPPCQAELPYFQSAYKEYGDQIQFMMVDLMDGVRETDAIVQAYMLTTGYTFPLFADRTGDASNAYEIYSIPRTIAVTPEGKLLTQRVGAMSEEDLNAIIEELLAQ